MNRTVLRLVSVLGLVILSAVCLFGQAETGTITGTLKDSTGAVVAGAKVEAKSVNTGLTRETTTNTSGIFTITTLRPDSYAVTIDAAGFDRVTQQIQVTVGGVTDVSTILKVGGTATTVEVTGTGGEAAAVNTENATMSTTITSTQIQELPTLTRDPYDLVATSGNVQTDNNSMRGTGYSINGQRSSSTDILLDGGQNVNTFDAKVGQTIPLDSVQEFSVLTNNFGAEYGRASGGVVNLVTKSGTNQFHGSAYEYNRVSALSSNTYNNNALRAGALADGSCVAGTPCAIGKKGTFTRNQFGFSIGGPVVKNKLFFFENTEWIRVRSVAPTTYNIVDPGSIPLLAPASQAFFSAYGKLAPGATTVSQSPCGSVTPILCDTVTFPVASDDGGGAPENTWETVARVDYNFSDKTTMFGRYAAYHENDFPGFVNASPYAGYNTGQNNFNQNITYSLAHVFTPNLVNTFKFIYNRLNNLQPLGTAPVGPTLYTSPSGTGSINGFPLVFPGYSATTPGNAIPFGGPQNLYQFYDDLAWTKGRHQFKFGGDYIQIRDNRTFGAYYNAVEGLNGAIDPNAAIDQLVAGNIYQFQGASYPQGKFPCPKNAAGHYQISPACTLNLPVTEPQFFRNNRYNDFAIYLSDTWKTTSRLTLNLGLRWEYYGVQHNASNPALDSNFYMGPGATLFDQIRNGSVQIADKSPVGGLWNPNYGNIGPRIGFAYDVLGDGSTSVRGGFGISYERNFGNVSYNVIQNPPNYAVVSLISNQDVPFNLPVFTDNAGPLAGTGTRFLPATSLRAVNQNINTAYALTWNFGVQRQVTRSSVLAVEYAGSHGVHLYDIANVNPGAGGNPDGCGSGGTYLGDARCANRLNYQYSNINFRSDNGYSHYNALNVRWTSNNLANKGLDFNAVYTWSHSTDNLSSSFSELYGGLSGDYYLGYIDPFNPKLSYGNSDFDIRNRFLLSGVWNMPFLKNSSNTFARMALGGWSIGTIFHAQTGSPYTIYDCSNFNGTSCPAYATNAATPTGPVGSPVAVGPNLFNYLALPSSANAPLNGNGVAINDLGNALGLPTCTGLVHVGCTYTLNGIPYPGRNSFFGPGYWNLDLNFYKNFKLTERFTLQFRSEFYNIFNHSNTYILSQNLDVSAVTSPFIQAEKGGIYGYAGQPNDERRNIQFALRLQF
jgi:outer membrane receptor protein involved in Fe transport